MKRKIGTNGSPHSSKGLTDWEALRKLQESDAPGEPDDENPPLTEEFWKNAIWHRGIDELFTKLAERKKKSNGS